MYDKEAVRKRMSELMGPVERQIMMTDNREELLMMACAMMQRTTEIFESELGIEGRKQMYKDMV
jgi:hypothetical protein